MTYNQTKRLEDTTFSILDLAPIGEDQAIGDVFQHSLELAQHAETWGYERFWLAEHHNMPGIGSAATSVLIGHVAGGTSTIRVGAGGIMLPNHAPLVIAEQFGTLASLYPGRIDLGLGRAPGSDQLTAQALGRRAQAVSQFPEQVHELRAYFDPSLEKKFPNITAVPGEGIDVPIWLLGSSDYSARLAGQLGLPFVFAGHFAPDNLMVALNTYRHHFQPSDVLEEPYVMIGINAVVADTDEEAAYLHTSQQQSFLNSIRGGQPGRVKPPVSRMDDLWSPYEEAAVRRQLRLSMVGRPEKVKDELQALIDETMADELIVFSQIYDHDARLRSYELLAGLWRGVRPHGRA